MEEISFSSQEELYKRIFPALKSKKKMMARSGFKYLKETDIWDYMRYNVWNLSSGLELCDMVDDILNTDNNKILAHYHNKYMPKDEDTEEIELPKLKS